MIDLVVTHAPLWPVLLPLLGASVTALLWQYRDAQRYCSLAVVLLMAAAALLLLNEVSGDESVGQQVRAIHFGGWSAPFGIVFVADGLAAAMVAVSGVLALAVAIFGLADVRRREQNAGFHPLFLGLLAGVNGAFLTGDLFNLYVWFEVMLITAMGLLIIGRRPAQLDGALRYAVLNLFSTLLLLAGIALLYGSTGTLNMAQLAQLLPALPVSPALTAATFLLLAGFGIKAGYFPLYFWLPASYHTASITVAAIFAGLLTKVGVYACFRLFTLVIAVDSGALRELLAWIAAGTMLFGVFGAAVQWDVRRILSFHIISQIGYMLLGLAIATPLALAGAIFYIVHHILVKANLFLLAGAIHRASGSFDLRNSGGLMQRAPLLAALFLVPALSLAGIPPLSGFWAKFLVIDATLRAGSGWLAALALLVGLLTLFSMSKIWLEAFWKAPRLPRAVARPVPAPMLAGIALLSLLTLLLGFLPQPLIVHAQGAADALLAPAAYIEAVLPAGGRP